MSLHGFGVPSSVEIGIPVSGDVTGAKDVSAINAALDEARLAGGGVVRLVRGQTYYVDDRIAIGSYCTLDATGATIVQVTATNKRVTTNYGWLNPAATSSDASMSAGGNTVTSATLAAIAIVGQSITVAGAAGPGSAPVTFCGLVSTVNPGANTITVTNLDGTALTAQNTVSDAGAVLYDRDVKPRVIGGFWQRGGSNHSGGGSDQSVHSFHHCDYPIVAPEGIYSQLGSDSGHCIDFADVTRAFGQIDHADYQGVGVQLTGPVYGCEIPRIVGTFDDDGFAITGSDWATNDIDSSGNVIGVHVGTIDVNSGTRVFNIIAGVGNLVDQIVIDIARGTSGNAIGGACIGDDTASASTVGGSYGRIDVRSLQARPKASTRCLNLISPSFKHIKIGLDYTQWTYSALKTFVELTGASAVYPQQLEITGYAELTPGQSNVNLFSASSTSAQLDHLIARELDFDQDNYSGNLIALQSGAHVNNIDLISVRHNIGSSGYSAATVSIAANATCNNLRIIGGHTWDVQTVVTDASTNAMSTTFAGGFMAQAPKNVYSADAAGANLKTITLAGCTFNSVSTAAFSTTGAPLTFSGDQMNTTGAFAMLARAASESVSAYGNRLPLDLAMLTRTVGEYCTDTENRIGKGAIPCICTTSAAGGWVTAAGGTY